MRRFKVLGLLVFAVFLAMVPVLAFAQAVPAATPAPGTVTIAVPQLGEMWTALLQFLAAAFASVLAYLVTSFVGYLRAHKVVQVSEAQAEQALFWAKLAATKAEEWAAAKIRAGEGPAKGEEKMHKAVEWLLANCPLKLTPEKAHAYAEVAVPLIGRGATAALDWARAHIAPLPPKDDAAPGATVTPAVAPAAPVPPSGGK
jgi:hypothetical protein